MRFLCLGLALFLAPLPVRADFVTLIPVADTTISEQNTANTSPGGDTMIVGRLGSNGAGSRARGLVRFDLSSIPANATISSVMFTVTVAKNHLETLDTLAVHRLTTDWDEFDASWDAGITPWDGGDFIQVPDATVMVQGTGPFTFVSGPALLATVRMWMTNAATNYGWILLNQDEVTLSDARRIGSREALGGQPALTIEYSVLPPPAADFNVTSPGSFYSINGGEPNPELTLVRGSNYTFAISTDASHPFEIVSDLSGIPYQDGVSGNNTSSGTITFQVPQNAPDTLYYICSVHFFGGTIHIVDPIVAPAPFVRILSIDLSSSNVVLKSTGTNGWLAVPEFSSNLVVSNWSVVPGFTNTFTSGTNVSVFNRLDPICGSNVYLRVRNTPN